MLGAFRPIGFHSGGIVCQIKRKIPHINTAFFLPATVQQTENIPPESDLQMTRHSAGPNVTYRQEGRLKPVDLAGFCSCDAYAFHCVLWLKGYRCLPSTGEARAIFQSCPLSAIKPMFVPSPSSSIYSFTIPIFPGQRHS